MAHASAVLAASLDHGPDLCLVGPPGAGKSTVLRRHAAARDPADVVFVDLSGCRDGVEASATVADALGVLLDSWLTASEVADLLRRTLADRPALTLILDEADAVGAEVAPLLEALAGLPGQRVVASAEPVGPGEVLPVEPLEDDACTALFEANHTGWRSSGTRVCRSGSPLAVRLAALNDVDGADLDDVIDAVLHDLPGALRRVLVAASCLRPPFTAPEVARVVERSVVEVVDALDQLRVRGLVRTRAVGAWTTLTLHIAVHRAARRLPERSGLHERARDLAVGPRERALLGSLGNHAAVLNRDLLRDETVLREVLEDSAEPLERVVRAWLLLEMASSLPRDRGGWTLITDRLAQRVQARGAPWHRAVLAWRQGVVARRDGALERARERLQDARKLAAEAEDGWLRAHVEFWLGRAAYSAGDFAAGARWMALAETRFLAVGDRAGAGWARLDQVQRDPNRSGELPVVIGRFREADCALGLARVYTLIAGEERREGQPARALQRVAQAEEALACLPPSGSVSRTMSQLRADLLCELARTDEAREANRRALALGAQRDDGGREALVRSRTEPRLLHIEGDLDGAEAGYRRWLEAASGRNPALVVGVLGWWVELAVERGDVAGATAVLEREPAAGERTPAVVGLLALAGRLDEARARAADSREILLRAGRTADGSALERFVGLVDVVEAELALQAGDRVRALSAVEAARGVADAPALEHDGDVIGRRILTGRLERMERALAATEPAVDALEVDGEGRWFRLPDGDEVRLGRRVAARRVLVALAHARAEREGPVEAEALHATGWPERKAWDRSARNRLHNAILALRRLGLVTWVVREGTGYALDPERPVRLVDSSRTGASST